MHAVYNMLARGTTVPLEKAKLHQRRNEILYWVCSKLFSTVLLSRLQECNKSHTVPSGIDFYYTSSWYNMLVFYMVTCPRDFALMLVPVYFIKHSVSHAISITLNVYRANAYRVRETALEIQCLKIYGFSKYGYWEKCTSWVLIPTITVSNLPDICGSGESSSEFYNYIEMGHYEFRH